MTDVMKARAGGDQRGLRGIDPATSKISPEHSDLASANQELRFHPLADIFPLMDGADFDALVADIKANGLRERIVVYDGKILDGRNRYRAMQALGWSGVVICSDAHAEVLPERFNPLAWVISANLHRRHLTADQKREVIAKLIKAQPEKSDRQVAKIAKASPTTVGTVRSEMEATGEVSKLDTRIDAKGVKQPARKRPAKKRVAAKRPLPDCPLSRDDEGFLDDEGNFAPADINADAACRIRGFMYRTQQSTFAAETDDLKGLTPARETVVAARQAADAWNKVAELLEAKAKPPTLAEEKRRDARADKTAADLVALSVPIAREIYDHIIYDMGILRLRHALERRLDEIERDREGCARLFANAIDAERELDGWKTDHPAADDGLDIPESLRRGTP
jgi:hypothetical protein